MRTKKLLDQSSSMIVLVRSYQNILLYVPEVRLSETHAVLSMWQHAVP